jgi:hypothetical protein
LGIYLTTILNKAEPVDGDAKLFPEKEQHSRFLKIFRRTLEKQKEGVILTGFSLGDLGTHDTNHTRSVHPMTSR